MPEGFDSFAPMMPAIEMSEAYVSHDTVRQTRNTSILACFIQRRAASPRFRSSKSRFIVSPRCASRRERARWSLESRSATYARASRQAGHLEPLSSFAGQTAQGSSTLLGYGRVGCTAFTYCTPSGRGTSGHTGTLISWSASSGWSGGSEVLSPSDCTTIPSWRFLRAYRRPSFEPTEAVVHPASQRCPLWAEQAGSTAGAP